MTIDDADKTQPVTYIYPTTDKNHISRKVVSL